MNKIRVAVLFGGQSSEHDISCISAMTVINSINSDYYDVIMVGITKEGKWLEVESVDSIQSGEWRKGTTSMVLAPDTTMKGFVRIQGTKADVVPVDVVFPVLHGLYGEDGTVQGTLELAKIPYVGCGVLASAVSMDKVYTKIVVANIGIRQADFVWFRRHELDNMDSCVEKVENKLKYPVFIKPSCAGSSVGVSKAVDRQALIDGLRLAAEQDEKILVEETIVGREIECAILGGLEPKASGVGEVLPAKEASFYDFDAKYNNAQSETDINPVFPEGKENEVREDAVKIFTAVDGFGLARIDFFLENGTNEVVFNELNTMPGFTAISMYPMLWGAKGLDKSTLVDKLIRTALSRRA